jgi:hypothetical protein
MLERVLTSEEIATLNTEVKRLKEMLASLQEDLEAGMPVQPQIDAVAGGIRTAEHMIRKYGKVAPVRPRRR